MILFPIKLHPSIKSFCECIIAKYEPDANTELSAFDLYFRRGFRLSNDCSSDSMQLYFTLFVLPLQTLCISFLYGGILSLKTAFFFLYLVVDCTLRTASNFEVDLSVLG